MRLCRSDPKRKSIELNSSYGHFYRRFIRIGQALRVIELKACPASLSKGRPMTKGKNALVTGSTSGIGLGIAEALCAAGMLSLIHI